MAVTDKTPLRFDYDDNTPSALGEYTASEVIGITNGGTGASSLTDFGPSLSSTVIISVETSSTNVSADFFNGMPYPPPFGYVQCDSDGTDSTSEMYFGSGATITKEVSHSTDISWDDSSKVFNVLKAGTYEVFANCVLDAGAQSDLVDIEVLKNGTKILGISPRCYGSHGPFTRTVLGVVSAVADDTLTVSIQTQNGVKTVTLKTGSSMTVKRLK